MRGEDKHMLPRLQHTSLHLSQKCITSPEIVFRRMVFVDRRPLQTISEIFLELGNEFFLPMSDFLQTTEEEA